MLGKGRFTQSFQAVQSEEGAGAIKRSCQILCIGVSRSFAGGGQPSVRCADGECEKPRVPWVLLVCVRASLGARDRSGLCFYGGIFI